MAEHKQVSGAPLNPYVMVDRIFKHLRDDDIVVCGNASACILPFQVGTLKNNQRLNVRNVPQNTLKRWY